MRTPARWNCGIAAALLILAASATAADARIGGLNMVSQTMHGMTMTLSPTSGRDWTRGYGARVAPPLAPPCQYGRRCPSVSSDQGGGGTGGFAPGGGSGTKPIKKPNLQ